MKIYGTVIRGQGRGADLGFPTANLQLEGGQSAPAGGVYAGFAIVASRVASLGGPPGTPSSEAKPSDAIARGKAGETGPATEQQGRLHHLAAIHIGPRPTFEEADPSVEAHLLDFSGDLYGKMLCLDIRHKLRDVKKFDTLEMLRNAIKLDCERTRDLLGN